MILTIDDHITHFMRMCSALYWDGHSNWIKKLKLIVLLVMTNLKITEHGPYPFNRSVLNKHMATSLNDNSNSLIHIEGVLSLFGKIVTVIC